MNRASDRRRRLQGLATLTVLATAAVVGATRARSASAAAAVPAHAIGARLTTRGAPAATTIIPRLTIARLHYDGGGDWYANPSSLPNLLAAIAERTTLPVERVEAQVTLADERLWDFPVLHVTGHGNILLSDADVLRLREYLARGGFLHVDDNYGLDASFRREIARVFPDRPLVDVPLSHAIYDIVYPFPQGLPKIHEHDGSPARGYGIFLGDRLAVYYSHASDLGNGWEDTTVHRDPAALHEAALRMGVNLFVYAVTSRPVE